MAAALGCKHIIPHRVTHDARPAAFPRVLDNMVPCCIYWSCKLYLGARGVTHRQGFLFGVLVSIVPTTIIRYIHIVRLYQVPVEEHNTYKVQVAADDGVPFSCNYIQ